MRLLPLVPAFLLFCVCTLIPAGAHAQRDEATVRALLVGKPLFLRGAWIEDKLEFGGDGQPARPYRTGPPSVSGFRAEDVDVRGDHLRVYGVRVGIAFDKSGVAQRIVLRKSREDKADEKVTIDVDLNGQPNFGPALQAIFTDDMRELPRVAEPSPGKYLPRCRAGQSPASDANEKPTCWAPPSQSGNVRAPVLQKSVDPDFSEWARLRMFSGDVEVHVWIDTDGLPSRVQVVRPVGMGLDEQAIAAVNQYRFKPATQDSQPVPVDLYIEVNFQIF